MRSWIVPRASTAIVASPSSVGSVSGVFVIPILLPAEIDTNTIIGTARSTVAVHPLTPYFLFLCLVVGASVAVGVPPPGSTGSSLSSVGATPPLNIGSPIAAGHVSTGIGSLGVASVVSMSAAVIAVSGSTTWAISVLR